MTEVEIYEGAKSTHVWLGDAHRDSDAAFDLLEAFCTIQKPRIYESLGRHRKHEHHEGLFRAWKGENDHSEGLLEAKSAWIFFQWTTDVSTELKEEHEINDTAIDQVLHWLITEHSNPSQEAAYKGLLDLLERPFWDRIWIVQEITVSRHIVLHAGPRSVGWYDMWLLITCGNLVYHLEQNHHWHTEYNSVQILPDRLYTLEKTRNRLRGVDPDPIKLREAMWFYFEYSASDKRDKIYALLGLTYKDSLAYGIAIDYGRSTTAVDVVVAAIEAIIRVDKEYAFDLVRSRDTRTLVPSWIPDFEDRLHYRTTLWRSSTAGGQGIPSAKFSDRGRTMSIAGVKVTLLDHDLSEIHDVLGEVEENSLPAWVELMIRHFSQRGLLTDQAIHGFLTVLLWGDFWRRPLAELLEEGNENLVSALTDLISTQYGQYNRLTRARFFISHEETMGLVPGNARTGDLIFVPCAVEAPIVVRETETQGRFTVVGECYVHGIMKGQLFDEDGKPKAHEITRIDLV